MGPVALVAVTVLAGACGHADAPSPRTPPAKGASLPAPPKISLVRTPIERDTWISTIGRGPGGRPVSTHFMHVDIAVDPALGMYVRFLNYEGEPEWRCTSRGALWVDHARRCFVMGTCPAMIAEVTGFEWGLEDLVEIANGGAPRAVPGETLKNMVTKVGCNVESTKPPLHSWRMKHAFQLAAAPPAPCPAPYEIGYSVLELPYSDDHNSVSFDWGDRKPPHMDPAQLDLSPPTNYTACPPRPGPP